LRIPAIIEIRAGNRQKKRKIEAERLSQRVYPSGTMRFQTRFFYFVALLGIFSTGSLRSESRDTVEVAGESDWKGKVLVIPVSGDVVGESRSVREFERMIEEANTAGVAALVLEIDISEPASWSDQKRILELVTKTSLPTVAFVNSSATGPGALIALASEAIYMTSEGIIGGAGLPEKDQEEDGKSNSSGRDESVLKARARSIAGTHGHRPEIADAFIDGEAEVKFGDRVVSAKGTVLTLTAAEAVELVEGKPLLAAGIVESIEELLKAEGLPAEYVRLSPREFGEKTSRDQLVRKSDGEKKDSVKAPGEEDAEDPALFSRREEGSYNGKIVILKIGEDTLATGDASFDFLDRTLKKAELDRAEAVILDMDTPGGFAWHTESLVLNSLQNVSFPTYTFVNPRAESAGAIIAIGTDHIYMRPAATIGSALVVSGTGQDLAESMEDKVTQMIIGSVRNVAELKGHNPDVAEAFVTRNKEVKIDGVVVHPSGNVLNLNTIRATEVIGGRPVLAKGVARDLDDLIAQEGLAGEVMVATPLALEAFAHWVQKLSFLLIIIGLAGAYIELNTPGFALPGFVSVGAFSLFFFGNYLAGNLAGYELAVLLVVGLMLIGLEIFILPGAIIPGFVGGALVLASLGLAMVDRVDFQWKWSGMPGVGSWSSILSSASVSLAAGMAGALIVVLLGMRFLPGTRLGNRLVLAEAIAGGASIPASHSAGAEKSCVGLVGEATTDLRPSGKGVFGNQYLDIISTGEFISKGESLKVVRHEGSRIVVEKV
jgi:membrane-bound serine protease (ClpP class)